MTKSKALESFNWSCIFWQTIPGKSLFQIISNDSESALASPPVPDEYQFSLELSVLA
jgi:hypothetical protein